ncbi:MAG TPA: hypothetical protein VL633_09915 [Bacteroidota bacterium]|jgi:hypothetical protein|nr:hypothetical protein [Bacteroidota bacterium]
MKYCPALIVLVLVSFLSSVAGTAPDTQTNKQVAFTAALKEKSVQAGSTATLLIRLRPQKGIHINLKPAISIIVDSTDGILRAGTPNIPQADSFLNTSKPIVQQVTLPAGLKKGKAFISGTVTYFFCSDAEGWCSRFAQPFKVPLTVR